MSTEIVTTNGTSPPPTSSPTLPEAVEEALVQGNLANLSPSDRVKLYHATCDSLGLNPLTTPFAYLSLNQKLILYATRNCTDQLRKVHAVDVSISSRERIDDIYVVTAHARLPNGRSDEEIGAVSVAGLKGEALANAMMRASTKAKRRVTLSIVGLSMLDETEVDTIPGAQHSEAPPQLTAPVEAEYREAPATRKVAAATPKVAGATQKVAAMTNQQFLDKCADELSLSLKDLKQLFPLTVNGFMRDGGYSLEDVYRLLEARTHDGTLLPHEQPSAAVQALLDDEPPPPNEADLDELGADLARAEAAGAAAGA